MEMVPTHYAINVAKNGQHFFATHNRSLRTKRKAEQVYAEMLDRFPHSEGWDVSITKQFAYGKAFDDSDLQTLYDNGKAAQGKKDYPCA